MSWMLMVAALAASPAEGNSERCLQQQLEQAQSHQTVGALRAACEAEAEPVDSSLAQRLETEAEEAYDRFSLTAHYNNYFLPFSYNHRPNREQWEYGPESINPWEVKFQLSFKVPVAAPWFNKQGQLYVAYTNQSWWQAYNQAVSAPFRETNHMPELFYRHQPIGWRLGNWQLQTLGLRLNHQSNGRGGIQSRSWNRIIGSALIARDHFSIGLSAWYRLKEDPKETPDDPRGDDNPDILDFMGHGELLFLYKHKDQNFSLRSRGNLTTGKGGIELGWSWPLLGKSRGYVQAHYGYGESLLDYNHKSERLSLGIEFTPWL
ncbi:phospholipase A [Ferrimonas gelatinilytica]|uniref:Phospholipase A1 n=1 Tax=Ferrimonas gelatinilytica TaxID=1255257 RepID=A0ABP9SAF8_9GAMM